MEYPCQKGSLFLETVLLLAFFGFAGTSLINLSSAGNASSANSVELTRADYTANSGFEIARKALDVGLDPSTTNARLDDSTFSIATDPFLGQVWTSAQSGASAAAHSITAQFAYQCTGFDTSSVYLFGGQIANLQISKFCDCTNDREIPVSFRIRVNTADCAVNSAPPVIDCPGEEETNPGENFRVNALSFDGDVVYDAALGVGSPQGLGAGRDDFIVPLPVTMDDNRSYFFVPSEPDAPTIRFDTTLPERAVFEVTANFADRSEVKTVFLASRAPQDYQPPPPQNNGFEYCHPNYLNTDGTLSEETNACTQVMDEMNCNMSSVLVMTDPQMSNAPAMEYRNCYWEDGQCHRRLQPCIPQLAVKEVLVDGQFANSIVYSSANPSLVVKFNIPINTQTVKLNPYFDSSQLNIVLQDADTGQQIAFPNFTGSPNGFDLYGGWNWWTEIEMRPVLEADHTYRLSFAADGRSIQTAVFDPDWHGPRPMLPTMDRTLVASGASGSPPHPPPSYDMCGPAPDALCHGSLVPDCFAISDPVQCDTQAYTKMARNRMWGQADLQSDVTFNCYEYTEPATNENECGFFTNLGDGCVLDNDPSQSFMITRVLCTDNNNGQPTLTTVMEMDPSRPQCRADQGLDGLYAGYHYDFQIDFGTVRPSGGWNQNMFLSRLDTGQDIPISALPRYAGGSSCPPEFSIRGFGGEALILEPGSYKLTIVGSTDTAVAIGGYYRSDPDTYRFMQETRHFYFDVPAPVPPPDTNTSESTGSTDSGNSTYGGTIKILTKD